MIPSQEQLNFFDTFGYLLIRQLFSPDEMGDIIEGFEWSIQNCGGGQNHNGTSRTMFLKPIEHAPEMCAILDHPSILGLIGGLLGQDFNYGEEMETIIVETPAGTLMEIGANSLPLRQLSI
tara:strand:+ start:20 stop:382 length:363 start_codon:yes stop_codon:yes gene_type:complete